MTVQDLVAEIEANGWTVEFKEWCEDAETPGLLGQRAGVCIPSRKAIKVKTHDMTEDQTVAVLEHEIEHMRGTYWATDRPELDLQCGGRVNGFGDPI